jgi:hypothetical protein
MENLNETDLEPRKEWVAPELKKIDVEELTAFGTSGGGDGASQS